MFGKKKEKAEDQLQMVKLCNVASFVDAESKLARLKNEGIHCYRMEHVLEDYFPDVQGRRTNDNPINKDGLYEDIDFLQEGDSKDNPSIVTIGTNKAGKKIESVSLYLHSRKDVY